LRRRIGKMAEIWLTSLGWGVFVLAVIIAIIIFSMKRKFYPIMFLLSIATYVYTIGFAIDKFSIGKNGILGLLIFSALLLILLGVYFSYKFKSKKSDFLSKAPRR